MIEEKKITEAIIKTYTEELLNYIDMDAAIAGSGPSGMVAAYYLAKSGLKTAVFERKLSIGGGMWGGGMMFNTIVVQQEGKEILDEFEIPNKKFSEGYYVADSVLATTLLTSKAILAGAKVFNGIFVEDVVLKEGRVCGAVVNWSTVEVAGLDVDPLTVNSKYLLDATGHDAEIVNILQGKSRVKLSTPSGKMEGERSMWAEEAEAFVASNTREAFSGLIVSGMAANATFGGPRMGPIFGGMLLSGKKAAQLIISKIREEKYGKEK